MTSYQNSYSTLFVLATGNAVYIEYERPSVAEALVEEETAQEGQEIVPEPQYQYQEEDEYVGDTPLEL